MAAMEKIRYCICHSVNISFSESLRYGFLKAIKSLLVKSSMTMIDSVFLIATYDR